MLKAISSGVLMDYVFTSLSKTGLKRAVNEDAVGVFKVEGGLLSIVCDGLGGSRGGGTASKLAVEAIKENFATSTNEDYLERLREAFINANKQVMDKAKSSSELAGMATTAEVLFIKDGTAYWGHIGDSRIYSLKNGKLKQLTKDHSLVQKMIDEGYLTLKQAEKHPKRHVILRALGEREDFDFDLSKVKINSGERVFFIMCTDGVTSEIADTEIEDIISVDYDLDVISGKLENLIESRGASDNFSFVLIAKSL